jgi:hypothetical protein
MEILAERAMRAAAPVKRSDIQVVVTFSSDDLEINHKQLFLKGAQILNIWGTICAGVFRLS